MRNNKIKRKEKRLTRILFIIYLMALIWIVLFKLEFTTQNLPHIRKLNLVPFGAVSIVNGRIDFWEILMNIIVFIPFGLYLSLLDPKQKRIKNLVLIACASLFLETSQYIFSIGVSDTTDLLGNTLGGFIGIILYSKAHHFFEETISIHTFFNKIALIGTISFIGGVMLMALRSL